jgi:hypothetical protein
VSGGGRERQQQGCSSWFCGQLWKHLVLAVACLHCRAMQIADTLPLWQSLAWNEAMCLSPTLTASTDCS